MVKSAYSVPAFLPLDSLILPSRRLLNSSGLIRETPLFNALHRLLSCSPDS